MMKTLALVPHQALARKWRQSSISLERRLLPFSIAGLVSHLLKEQGFPYRASSLLEEVALWEAVWQLADQLEYFSPLVNFPGFVEDLHRLFTSLNSKDLTIEQLPTEQQQEIATIYQQYQANLVRARVLDLPAQISQAMKYWPESQLAKEIDTVEIYYLGNLSQLEKEFVQLICEDKQVIKKQFSDTPGLVTGLVAKDPKAEVQAVAEQIVKLLKSGIEPNQIGVSAPRLSNYLPMIIQVFSVYNIPWTLPNNSLADTPLGKTVTALLQVLGGKCTKQELKQLIAVGWGLPLKLSVEERRAFKFAPESLAGLSAWKRQLELYPGWQELLTILLEVNVTGKKLIKNFATVLFEVLEKFDVQQWPAADELAWAVHKQAWDGLHQALRGLSEGRQFVSIQQFAQLLQNAMNSYFLPQPLTFQQQVNVTAMEQLVGMDQYCIFLLGMTEDSFPSKIKRDWLTQQIQTDHSLDLYDQILRSAVQIQLSYPETNLDNSVNIASPIFPEEHEHFEAAPTIIMPGSFGDYPAGQLAETEIIERIIQRYQQKSLSVSRLNLYATCPYKFFCAELLDLTAGQVEELEITALEEGNLLHLVLKLYWEQQGRIPIQEILEQVYLEHNHYLTRRIRRMIDKFNQQDIVLVNSSEFYPRYLEQSFDNLKITSPTGSIRLRGVIDRIDLNSDGEYVIYDYKSGGSPSTTEIIEGIDIQLQAYTLAAANIITDGNLVGIGFYTLRDGKRSGLWSKDHNRRLGIRGGRAVLEPDQWQNITNDFMMTLSNYVSRIFAGDFPIEPQKKGACDYCDFRVICRREG